MGTLNPYRAPFLDVNWIINTANTIGVNHFQLKLISKMFEMFVLLINEGNPHSFSFVFFLLHAWSSPTQRIAPHHLLYCIFENLSWEFVVRICRRYLPFVFLYIYKRILFCIYEQILFIWRQTFSICAQNFLTCEIFFINSVSSCYCRGSYGPPYIYH